MSNQFKTIHEVFNSDNSFSNFRSIIKDADVVLDFFKIFPDLEKVVTPEKVVRNKLTLRVENSVLRHTLFSMKDLIIHKINEFYKEERITFVIFK